MNKLFIQAHISKADMLKAQPNKKETGCGATQDWGSSPVLSLTQCFFFLI